MPRRRPRVPGLASGPHLVLKAPHPSPLSAHAGFFGCRHFSQTNAFLAAMAAPDRLDAPPA
jgi:uracil-DNA glycosylase